MTQITRKSARERGLVLLLAMFLGAGLVLTGCGDDDTATTPAPAPPPPPAPATPEPTPEPEPPAPEAPAAPTGLMASATVDSITWTWDPVEGAAMYAIQVSMDEMFDDTDAVTMTTETTHTESDLEPETSLYARVRSAAGTTEDPVQSAWTTHVTGMSGMAPPPAPDPVMVTFTLEKGLPLMPDKSTNKEKAMAKVNPDIVVTSNMTAMIELMGFEDGSPVSLQEGENMPFKFVDWNVLQSKVVADGVTFRITRQTLGANQEMTPTGDVAYVSCNPFECEPGMDAPEVTANNSAVCAAWNPTARLEVGVISPTGLTVTAGGGGTPTPGSTGNPQCTPQRRANCNADSRHPDCAFCPDPALVRLPGQQPTLGDFYPRLSGQQTAATASAGLDLGWVYTANATVNITHDFGAITASGGTASRATSDAPLPKGRAPYTPPGGTREPNRRDIVYARNGGPAASDPAGTATPRPNTIIDVDGCYTATGSAVNLYDDTNRSSVVMPRNCFRFSASRGGPDYFSGYSLKLTPKSSGVPWGEINWFEDLKCNEGTTFEAADALDMDVCDLLEAEVDTLRPFSSSGALKIEPTVILDGANRQLTGFDPVFAVKPRRWTQLLYLDDKTRADPNDTVDLYDDGGSTSKNKPGRLNNGPTNGIPWFVLQDANSNPNERYGDIGKVDAAAATTGAAGAVLGGDGKPDNGGSNAAAWACSADDGGVHSTSAGRSTLCDATIPLSIDVTFVDGMGFDCRVPKTYDIVCDWKSTGSTGLRDSMIRRDLGSGTTDYVDNFLTCRSAG